MNDFQMYNGCFVPQIDKSDAGGYDDLDNLSEFADYIKRCYSCETNQNIFENKSKTRRSNRLENDEIGLTMQIKRNEMLRNVKRLPIKYEDIVVPIPAIPSDCCHHKEPGRRRKFIISFGANNANLNNDCLINERNRCQNFWKFIDSHSSLKELITEGEFQHSSPPHLAIVPSIRRRTFEKKKAGEILRAKNKELHDAEQERKTKRTNIIDELQKKSGQAKFVRKQDADGKPSLQNNKKNLYADAMKESFSEIMREMKIFDKACGNPVSVGYLKGHKRPITKSNDIDEDEIASTTLDSVADTENENEK